MKRRELFTGTELVSAACRPGTRRMATLIPNAPFRTHDGRNVRFYDDPIKDKQVIVMMMYANCDTFCPLATKIMVDLHHKSLAHRMGKDLFMVNVSLKPWEDDPATLREYAKSQGALLPGWTFLTGDRYDVDTLRYRFFSHDHIGIDLDEDLHAGSMKLINDRMGRWLHGDAFATTRTLLDHIEWLKPPKSLVETRKENEQLQKRIDQERDTFGYRKIA